MWINQVKVMVAGLAFLTALILSNEIMSSNPAALGMLATSGLVGLCIGDIFLFRAFASLGPGRTLVLFSFQPLLLGLYGYFFLGQFFTLNQSLSVVCMIMCIYIFMMERNKLTGSWDLRSFLWAFIGIALDSFGVMLTRSAYEFDPSLETFQVNLVRCLGAITGFILMSPKGYFQVAIDVKALKKREITLLLGAALCGTFISLALYLTALKSAHVGTLTAISITGPVWVSLLECLYQRKLPGPYLLWAFAFFLLGFYLMLLA